MLKFLSAFSLAAIRSKYDPQTAEPDIDYSMSNPLLADGSNYPCKNYNTPEAYAALDPVATLTAGSPFKVQFAAGGATHLGGSCQFSVSYDQGKTFAVIYSVVGGCPLSYAYSVPIPASLPSSPKATFAWTWVSRATREMYGNCAIVAIKGDGSAKSFTGPGLFRANTLSDGTCISPNNADVVYPNPGTALEYGGSITSSSPPTPLEPCSYNQVTTVTISPDKSSSSTPKPSASSSSTPKPSTSSKADPSTTSVSHASTRTSVSSPPTTSVVSIGTPTATRLPWVSRHVVSGSVGAPTETSRATTALPTKTSTATAAASTKTTAAASSKTSSAKTSSTTTTSSRSVTSSTQPSPTSPSAEPSSGSNDTSSAYLKCLSAYSFALCAGSSCTDMGAVAPGTMCQNNTIIMAPAAKVKRMDKMVRRAGPAYLHTRPLTH